jgi:hypothetical protein
MTTPSPVKPLLTTADLPAAVLSAINACVGACRATLIQLEGDRDRLRGALARRIHPAPDGPVRRLCAVDGAHAMAPAAGATFAAIAAVAVEDATLTDQDVLVQLMPPVEELETIIGGARTVMELRLLAKRIRATTSGLFILDGSFYSVLLEINRLLVRHAQDARRGRMAAWWTPFDDMLTAFFCRRRLARSAFFPSSHRPPQTGDRSRRCGAAGAAFVGHGDRSDIVEHGAGTGGVYAACAAHSP